MDTSNTPYRRDRQAGEDRSVLADRPANESQQLAEAPCRATSPPAAAAARITAAYGVDAVPASTALVAALPTASYADRFAMGVDTAAKSPLEWARMILEKTSLGRSAPTLWQAIGLRLGPTDSSEHVQGWAIGSNTDRGVRLEAKSYYLTARAVVEAPGDLLALSLFVRFDHPVAHLLWPPVAVLHRRVAPQLLRQAVGPR